MCVSWAREQFAAVKFQAIVFNARNPNFANGLRLISTGTHPRTSPVLVWMYRGISFKIMFYDL